MLLSERRNKIKEEREVLLQMKVERAKIAAQTVINSDQFKMSAINTPEAKIATDVLINEIVSSVTNPVNDFLDVMRAKGFRSGEIRNLVHRLYTTFCMPLDTSDKKESGVKLLYEDMLPPVADYLLSHQEIYNSITPEELRNNNI